MIYSIAGIVFAISLVLFLVSDFINRRMFRKYWRLQNENNDYKVMTFLKWVERVAIILSLIVSVFRVKLVLIESIDVAIIIKATGLFLLSLVALTFILVFNDSIDKFLFKYNIQISIEPLLISLFIFVILSETTIVL